MSRVIIALVLVFASAASTFAADSVPDLLREADRFRLPEGAVIVQSKVELHKGGTLEKERLYEVYIKPERQVLRGCRPESANGE